MYVCPNVSSESSSPSQGERPPPAMPSGKGGEHELQNHSPGGSSGGRGRAGRGRVGPRMWAPRPSSAAPRCYCWGGGASSPRPFGSDSPPFSLFLFLRCLSFSSPISSLSLSPFFLYLFLRSLSFSSSVFFSPSLPPFSLPSFLRSLCLSVLPPPPSSPILHLSSFSARKSYSSPAFADDKLISPCFFARVVSGIYIFSLFSFFFFSFRLGIYIVLFVVRREITSS